MLNLSSRQFKIDVGALDVTFLVEYFEVGDDRVSSSGLISTRGTIKLRYNPVFNAGRDPKISLDPKIPNSAPYWARGVSVKLWLNDTTLTLRKHPRHSLRILSTKFDRNELSLTIEVGCLLALLDSQQPEGDESETCVNQRRTVDDVIRSLLVGGARDYPSVTIVYLGFVPGYIESPQEKGASGSYVGEAGKVAYGRGYALWVNKDEQIKAIRIAPQGTVAQIVLDADRDAAEYVRNDAEGSSAETPYDRIRVRYNVVTVTETSQSYTQTTESYGATEFTSSNVLISREKITDIVDWGNATREIKTECWKRRSEIFPWAFGVETEDGIDDPADRLIKAEEIYEDFFFEGAGTADLNKACPEEGENGQQGRLLSKGKKVYRACGWVLAEWIEQHEILNALPLKIKVEDDGLTVGIGGADSGELIVTTNPLILYLEEKTTYQFLDGTNITDELFTDYEGNIKAIVMKRRIHQAAIFPKAWKYTRRSPNIPSAVVEGGGRIETWNRRVGTREWQHRVQERKTLGEANRAACDARFKKALSSDYSDLITPDSNRALAVSNVRRFAEQLTTTQDVIKVSSTQQEPPSPEFIPERYSREEEQIVEEFPLNSQYSTGGTGKIKEITLDAPIERRANGSFDSPIVALQEGSGGLRGFNDDLEQAKEQARMEALLVWARFRSITATYDLQDFWFDALQLPLTRFDILDRDRITDTVYRHSYIVDGWTNAVTLRECICAHDGLWLGTAVAVVPVAIRVTAPIDPSATVIETAPTTYELQPGDTIVLETQEVLTFAETAQNSLVVALLAPTTTEILAGTTILVAGFPVVVATTAPIGSMSISLTAPLPTPINTGQQGTVGTVTTVTEFVPVGSTAIPVTATPHVATISLETVTADTETIISPVTVPDDFVIKGVTTIGMVEIPATPVDVFTIEGVGQFPPGLFVNIGTDIFTIEGESETFWTQGLIDPFRIEGVSEIIFDNTALFNINGIGEIELIDFPVDVFSIEGVGEVVFDADPPVITFRIEGVSDTTIMDSPIDVFEIKGVGEVGIIDVQDIGSFEIIAVW